MEQAQQLFAQFLTTIRPDSIGDIIIYVIFFLTLITSVLIPDGNGRASNLCYGTMALCAADLLFGQRAFISGGNSELALLAYVAHVGMFILPAITAGSIRIRDKKGRASIPLSALTALIGLVYLIASFANPAAIYARTF